MHLTTVHISRKEVLVLCPSLFVAYICGGERLFLGFHRCWFSLSSEYGVRSIPLLLCPLFRGCKERFTKQNNSLSWSMAICKLITQDYLCRSLTIPVSVPSSTPVVWEPAWSPALLVRKLPQGIGTGVQHFLSNWGSSLAQI